MFHHDRRHTPAPTRVALAVASALAAGGAAAAPDTSEWECRRCPFPQGADADYTVGAEYVSDDAVRFGNATGYDEKGGYLALDGDGLYAAGDYRMTWYFEDLGLDSRYLQIEGGDQGLWDYEVAYREIPYRLFGTTSTVFTNAGGATLTLPAGWVRAGTTNGLAALGASLFGQNIESDRTIIDVGGRFMPFDGWSVYADYRRQEKEGVDIVSGSYFTNAAYLARPLDWATDEIDAGVRYQGERAHVQLAFYGSYFQNRNLALTWENPFTGPDLGRLAQAPDNRFTQLSLSGNYRMAAADTVLSYSAAIGTMEQDDALLPYTINPALTPPPLPRATLDGEVDTTNLAIKLTSRPTDNSQLRLAYRVDERDNATPRNPWDRVIVDSFVTNANTVNFPYSFDRTSFSVAGEITVFDDVGLSAGYDRTELERDFQEVAEQTEDEGWARVRWAPLTWLDLNARGGTATREIDRYDEAFAQSLGQNPLLRKYHLAYRYREFGELMVNMAMPERPVSLSGTVYWADDSYSRSELGLQSSESLRLGLDLSWAVSETSSLYVAGGWEEIEAVQLGSESFGAPDWSAEHNDDFTTLSAGFRVREIAERFDFELDYTRADGQTEIVVASGNGGAFPDLESTLDVVRARGVYTWSPRLDAIVELRYEQFEAEDWALRGVEPATMPTILTLGADPYDYDVFVFGVGFRYAFGGPEEEAD